MVFVATFVSACTPIGATQPLSVLDNTAGFDQTALLEHVIVLVENVNVTATARPSVSLAVIVTVTV